MKLRKIHDFVKMLLHKLLRMPQHTAVEEDVFPGGHLLVEAGPQLDEGCDEAVYGDGALIGLEDAADGFQKGGLTGAVGADEAPGLSLPHLKTHVLHRQKLLEHKLSGHQLNEVFLQVVNLFTGQVKPDGHMVHVNDHFFIVHGLPLRYTG